MSLLTISMLHRYVVHCTLNILNVNSLTGNNRGFQTRMVYLYCISCLRYTILVGNPQNINGEKLSDLRFAYEVPPTTEGLKDMEHQLNMVNEVSLEIGLSRHKGETKSMTNVDTTDNIQIEKVTNFKYLGANNSNGTMYKARSFVKNKSRTRCFGKAQRNLSGQAPSHESETKGFQPVCLISYGISMSNIVSYKCDSKETWN